MKFLKFITLLIIPLALSFGIKAQVSIDVKLDTNMLLIGDQTNFVLEATFPQGVDVILPVYSDTIIENLEVLNVSSIDTFIDNDLLKIRQSYLVTSFDSGWYEIPPVDFKIVWDNSDKEDSVLSNPVYFGVISMPLDTANADAITDIKPPLEAPITFKEIMPFAGGGLALLILLFLAYYIYKRFIKKEAVFVKKEKPKEPAHLIALRDLDILKDEKIWQKGNNKAYYSKLTDIVRTYIEDRYNVSAMEQTTDEIVESFKYLFDIPAELKERLFETLKQADFVKFAKANTLAEENERAIKFAYDFVLKTKLTVQLHDDESNSEVEKTDLQEPLLEESK